MRTDHSLQLRVAIVVPAKKFLCLGELLWIQRYGPLQVASVVQEAGFFVRLFNEELGTPVPEAELASDYDVIGFSCKSSAITRAEEIAERIKKEAQRRNRCVTTVLGGEHASMCAGQRLAACFDYVLPGESEEAFLSLLQELALQETRDDESIQLLPCKRFYTCQSFDNIPDLSLVEGYETTLNSIAFRYFPLYWMIRNKKYPMLSFQSSRGCPYNCAFCPTPRYLQGHEYRRRGLESGLQYLKDHLEKTGIRRVIFEDPNAAIPFDKLSYSFFDSLAKSSVRIRGTVLVRIEICRDQKLLEIMRAAGVVNLSVGIESLNELTRNEFNKKMSLESINEAIDVFHRLGFSVTGLFIVGYDTDDLDSLASIEQFILKTGIEKWRVSPLTQMLELPDQFMPAYRFFLWDEFASFGRDVVDYGNGEFVLFYPKHITPSSLQKSIMDFNRSSTSTSSLVKLFLKRKKLAPVVQRLETSLAQRLVEQEIVASNYLEMVQEIEKPFYSAENGTMSLREERLLQRHGDKIQRPRGTEPLWETPS